jgi:hypothetical protein
MPKAKKDEPKQPTVGEVLQEQVNRLDLILGAVIRVVGKKRVQVHIDAIVREMKKAKAAKNG